MKKRLTMATLAALVGQLEQDADRSSAELRRRDRAIGKELESLRDDPQTQLLAWLSRVTETAAGNSGSAAVKALRLGSLILVVGGLVLGWFAAAAIFYYDGSKPVNVIHGLAIFVGLQLLLLLLLGVALLPKKVLKLLPGMLSLQESLQLISPGRLQRLLHRRLPERYRNSLASFLGRSFAHRQLFGNLEKWVIIRSGQAFGIAFNLGALAGCLYLIVFTDLAFGWSTTLDADANQMQLLSDFLAWPWATLFPEGRPSLELIEATRYFRLQPGILDVSAQMAPEILGGWWPFLILCILCYGLLPRTLLWSVSQLCFQRALQRTILQLTEIPPLLERLNTRLVETSAPEQEINPRIASEPLSKHQGTTDLHAASISAVDWSDTGLEQTPLSAWLEATGQGKLNSLHPAGGARSLEQDRQVINQLCTEGTTATLILVKAWEPPMAEFLDFIRQHRQLAGKQRRLAVVPLGVGSISELRPPEPGQLEIWSTMVEQLGDPWTFVTTVLQKGGE